VIDTGIRKLVRKRAGEPCEYCKLPENVFDIPFHVEHVVAKQHVTLDRPSNLALACDRCNLYKGPNLTSIDPETGRVIELFNPREDDWNEHFALHGAVILGLTPTGRATVRLLRMNAQRRIQLRRELSRRGER
jgi:5-methylcytosine-specific restriction endonuclease McrA